MSSYRAARWERIGADILAILLPPSTALRTMKNPITEVVAECPALQPVLPAPPLGPLRHRVGALPPDPRTCLVLQSFGDPDLDDRLACHSEPSGLPIQELDHPDREVHVDAPLHLVDPACLLKVEGGRDVLSLVEPAIELMSLHRWLPPLRSE